MVGRSPPGPKVDAKALFETCMAQMQAELLNGGEQLDARVNDAARANKEVQQLFLNTEGAMGTADAWLRAACQRRTGVNPAINLGVRDIPPLVAELGERGTAIRLFVPVAVGPNGSVALQPVNENHQPLSAELMQPIVDHRSHIVNGGEIADQGDAVCRDWKKGGYLVDLLGRPQIAFNKKIANQAGRTAQPPVEPAPNRPSIVVPDLKETPGLPPSDGRVSPAAKVGPSPLYGDAIQAAKDKLKENLTSGKVTQRGASEEIRGDPTLYSQFISDSEAMRASRKWTELACEARAPGRPPVQDESGPAFTNPDPNEGIRYSIIAAGPGGHLGLLAVTRDAVKGNDVAIGGAPCIVVHRTALVASNRPLLAVSDQSLREGEYQRPARRVDINLAGKAQVAHTGKLLQREQEWLKQGRGPEKRTDVER